MCHLQVVENQLQAILVNTVNLDSNTNCDTYVMIGLFFLPTELVRAQKYVSGDVLLKEIKYNYDPPISGQLLRQACCSFTTKSSCSSCQQSKC